MPLNDVCRITPKGTDMRNDIVINYFFRGLIRAKAYSIMGYVKYVKGENYENDFCSG